MRGRWRLVQERHLRKDSIEKCWLNSVHPCASLGALLGRHEVLENRLVWLDIKKNVGGKIWKSRQWKGVAVHFMLAKGC